ncbi:MAG: pitrilysin family protein [Trueperella sp.]|nr:pitrilysin family protein [Trueperella sp.]
MTYSRLELPLTPAEITFSEDGVVGKRSILPGGVRVITENVPGQKSVSVGFWVGSGSRDEAPGYEGSTHFLEHLLFKGTQVRDAKDISQLGDFLGGSLNAATAQNYTVYHGRVFDSDLPQLLELLCDMFLNSQLDPAAMEVERGVILEELAAIADDVSQVALQAALPQLMQEHPLSRPIGGTAETVQALTNDHMRTHFQERYIPSELVVTATGAVEHEEFCAVLQALLNSAGWELAAGALPAPRRRTADISYGESTELYVPHPAQQADVLIAIPGLAIGDSREPVLNALTAILGGGTSSRLFQEVREKRGLAYSAYAGAMKAAEGGAVLLEAQCHPENTAAVAELMGQALDEMAQTGVTAAELETAYRQIRAQTVFAMESSSFRRNRLGMAELLRGELVSIEYLFAQAREVTAVQIQELAGELAAAARIQVIAGGK